MALEDGLDLGRVDVLAPGDDQIGPTIEDLQAAVPVESADVARREPTVAQRRG